MCENASYFAITCTQRFSARRAARDTPQAAAVAEGAGVGERDKLLSFSLSATSSGEHRRATNRRLPENTDSRAGASGVKRNGARAATAAAAEDVQTLHEGEKKSSCSTEAEAHPQPDQSKPREQSRHQVPPLPPPPPPSALVSFISRPDRREHAVSSRKENKEARTRKRRKREFPVRRGRFGRFVSERTLKPQDRNGRKVLPGGTGDRRTGGRGDTAAALRAKGAQRRVCVFWK